MGQNVTEIGAYAFKGCKVLTGITLPAKTTKIGDQAFSGCKKLKTITIKSSKITSKIYNNKSGGAVCGRNITDGVFVLSGQYESR